jgi:hypothetical protein
MGRNLIAMTASAALGTALVAGGALADQALTISTPGENNINGNPPNPCVNTIVSGQLQGGPAGVRIELFQNPYPFTAGFTDTGLSAVTDAAGNYAIIVTPRVKTMYHVVASTSPETVSPDITEKARSCARIHVSDPTPKRGQLVRFYGTVVPAKDGKRLRLYEPESFGGRKIGQTTLRHNNKDSSKFSLKAHVRKGGEYSVSVPADAANEHGGGFITLHVHR